MPDTKEAHAERCDQHQANVYQYLEHEATDRAMFGVLVEAYQEAKQALIESGALEIGEDGNILAGWYNVSEHRGARRVSSEGTTGIALTGGAGSIAAAIGAPVAAWTMVGAFGTASTGAAISGLSGAAATSATAAWFGGGAVAAGGLGMAAAPLMLTGIGAVAGVAILAAAGILMAGKNRRNARQMADANAVMEEAEHRMNIIQYKLLILKNDAVRVTKQLVRTTAILEGNKSDEAVADIEDGLARAEELFREFQEPLPYARLYLEKPGKPTITQTTVTPDSVHIAWYDSDNGESEITKYTIKYSTGFWGEAKSLPYTVRPTLQHMRLEAGKTYEYIITAVNALGEGEPAIIQAKTNP